MSKRNKRVIPGFGLSMGVTLTMLSIIVIIPLASLIVFTANLSLSEIIDVITKPRVLASFKVSFLTAFIASAINAVMGVILAWVLVRYDFPFKRVLDGMIELPFALPTAVAGIALTSLTADQGLIGGIFAKYGIKIAYTRIGITAVSYTHLDVYKRQGWFYKGLSEINKEHSPEEWLDLIMEFGNVNLKCMELLDTANTESFGNPVPTRVNTDIKKGPFIVISGHDLGDLQQLLQQTEGKGINIDRKSVV